MHHSLPIELALLSPFGYPEWVSCLLWCTLFWFGYLILWLFWPIYIYIYILKRTLKFDIVATNSKSYVRKLRHKQGGLSRSIALIKFPVSYSRFVLSLTMFYTDWDNASAVKIDSGYSRNLLSRIYYNPLVSTFTYHTGFYLPVIQCRVPFKSCGACNCNRHTRYIVSNMIAK